MDGDTLHERAGAVRDAVFGRAVFVRAVVELSNHCQRNCSYCGMRRDNRGLERFRLETAPLAESLLANIPESVTDINLQSGEDPQVVEEVALPLIGILRRETRLGISVSFGLLRDDLSRALRDAGAGYYVMKFETADAEQYRWLHAPAALERRLEAIRNLAAAGWRVSSGFIVGLPGAPPNATALALRLLEQLPLAGASVRPFIPGPETPLADAAPAPVEQALHCVALMRLASPRWFIPAVSAMAIGRKDAYTRALRNGANLATINLTPPHLRGSYPIYRRDRIIMTERLVLDHIAAAGCVPSPVGMLAWRPALPAAPINE